MVIIRLWVALCALTLYAGNIAYAIPITFTFTGSVTDDPFGLSSFGAPITGSYTFDSVAADGIAGPSTGSYPSIGPSFGFSATVDGTPYSLSGSLIVNTANNIGVDQYGAISTDGVLTLELFLQDSTQTALSSDALPLVPPLLAAFDTRQFRLFGPDAEFLGTIRTLVCSAGCDGAGGGGQVREPKTMLLLLLAGLLSILARGRKVEGSVGGGVTRTFSRRTSAPRCFNNWLRR